MSKMRVHELAKEVDKTNKEIIEFLIEKKVEVKSHMSALEEDQVELVRKNLGNKKIEKEDDSQAKKKSTISQVYNPQNSRANKQQPSQVNSQHKQTPVKATEAKTEKPANYNANRNNNRNNSNNTTNTNKVTAGGNVKTRTNQEIADATSNARTNQGNSTGYNNNKTNQGTATGNNNIRTSQGSAATGTGYNNNRSNQGASTGNNNNRSNQGATAGNNNYRSNQGSTAGNNNNRSNQGNATGANNSRPNQGGSTGNRPNQGGGRRPNQGNSRFNRRGQGRKQQPVQQQSLEEVKETIKTIIIPEILTIKDLADKMKIQPSAIVKKLFLEGKMVTVNQELDFDTAEEIALEFNCIAELEVKVDVIAELLKEDEEDQNKLTQRPPVVCVMGHVDHGKTSLLDAIRNTHVTDRESGGITQHIGAYVVKSGGQKITFLDTPGHEAFTAMRMRGANATDIAILVIAADDGVMPQTVEAINHAKAAGIEIIVAINKMDKPSANIERVKQELSEHELIPEDWGGKTIFVPVSAHTHEGIEQLLEMILLTAEVCELKANPKRTARGLVVEAQLDKGKGPVATVLVQKGTLKVGQPIAAGSCYGKVRAMMDDKGRRVKEAGPSTPVEILGLSGVPKAGDIFVSVENEKEARIFAETFISQGREKLLDDTKAKLSLDDLFTQIQAGNVKELGIIVKADVQGSVEAVKESLLRLSNEEVVVKIIHGGVGAINESDVILASASNAIIIGFNVRPDPTAKITADREGVDLRQYKVIYNAIEDVEAAMKGMRDPIFEEKVIGHAEIRLIFKSSGVGNIAGSYVLDGIFKRGCSTRINRDGTMVYEGKISSLKRFKDDVKEVKTGFECGLVFEDFDEVKEGDLVEAFTMVEVER